MCWEGLCYFESTSNISSLKRNLLLHPPSFITPPLTLHRWSQILDQGKIPSEPTKVLNAAPPASEMSVDEMQRAYAPPPLEETIAQIMAYRPDVVFAPHVETSTGIILPDEFVQKGT